MKKCYNCEGIFNTTEEKCPNCGGMIVEYHPINNGASMQKLQNATAQKNIKLTTITPDNVTELGMVSGVGAYGVGLFTYIAWSFCNLIGVRSDSYSDKMDYAKNAAIKRMIKSVPKDTDGIMDIHFSLSLLSVIVSGTAYKYNNFSDNPQLK